MSAPCMQVDIRVPVGTTVPGVVDFIARCEDAGFDGVGVHDHPHRGRDVFMTLALAAARTRRLRLYPATSSPVVRHPLLLASATHSLQEIAPGRVCLTVAPGFLAARAVGRSRGTVAFMREAVLAIRRLLAWEPAEFEGQTSRLLNTSAPPALVYLLAAGPRMVELAGEVADGAMLMVGLHPQAIQAARQHLEAGARRSGRSLARFHTIFIVTMGLADRLEDAQRWPQRWVAPGQSFLTYPSAANLYWLRHAGSPSRWIMIRHLSPTRRRRGCATRSGCSDRPSAAGTGCFKRGRRPGWITSSSSRRTLEGGGDLPSREVEAFARIIRPDLSA
jgi:5,10-methylenetetrahydromethanopterin reductase